MTDMTDDPMQDPSVLASAYLDGEVTPDERARVEADPELLAEVDRLRQVRAVIGADVEPAPLSVREAHLAAALGVWDQLGGDASTPSGGLAAASPIAAGRARRDRRRAGRDGRGRDRTQLLLGAAAGLVVLAGVGAVVRGVIVGSGDDDSVADSSDDASEEAPAEDSIGPAESDIATELEGGNTNDELRTDIDPNEVASDLAAVEAEAEPADEPADEPAEEPAEEAMEEEAADDGAFDDAADADEAASVPGDAPQETDLVILITPQDLADFAAPAAYGPDPIGGDVEERFVECGAEPPAGLGIDRLAEFAIVTGDIVRVGADLDEGIAYAFRDDCSIVLDAVLPTEDEFLAQQADTPTTTAAP